LAAGKVIIQAYNVDHYAVKHACNQDYESFANEELSYRKRLYYPPYFRLGRMVFQAKDANLLSAEMQKVERICTLLEKRYTPADLIILGPAPAPNAKVNKYYRYHIILKAASPQILSFALGTMSKLYKPASTLTTYIDVDPMMLM
jgi:primosomal protein N' (replication factor Y)